MHRAARVIEAICDYYRDILGSDRSASRPSPVLKVAFYEVMVDLLGWVYEAHEHTVASEHDEH